MQAFEGRRESPGDHSKIEVDEAALRLAHEERTAAVEADRVYTAEAALRKVALQREIAAQHCAE